MRSARSRAGCFTCRRRKKKCNEQKPICVGCRRNKLQCMWPASPLGQSIPHGSALPTDYVELAPPVQVPIVVSAVAESHDAQRPRQHEEMSGRRQPDSKNDEDQWSGLHSDSSAPIGSVDVLSTRKGTEIPVSVTLGPVLDQVPLGLSLIPQYSHQSSELLSYYLTRTANSMGNASTDINPFVSKLIPLAFDNPLIMQLILAQSAAHRKEELQDDSAGAIAQQYYTKSLRLFSQEIDAHVDESQGGTLVLSFGSLIMSLTEIARGEINGTVFDHLGAAGLLVSKFVSNAQHDAYDSLFDFLIEYYTHMTATSMLSIDVQYGSQPFFNPSIGQAAETLVTKSYIGQMCGAWLELLLLIPKIFQLGQSMMKKPTPHDTIITFGCYQSQIQAFYPSSSASDSAITAGLVFKQAVLLYLWTILGNPLKPSAGDAFSNYIRGAVNEAFTQLDRLSTTERVNTSLCWPITIIGCCTADSAIRSQLRERLQIMSRTIGLGNIRRTLSLLECVWKGDPENLSPWTLHSSMQEQQIWVSLA